MSKEQQFDKRHADALVELYAKASADHFKDCHGCGGGAHKAGLLAVFASAASHARQSGERITPAELEHLIEWHDNCAKFSVQSDNFVGEEHHQARAAKLRKVDDLLCDIGARSAPSTTRESALADALQLVLDDWANANAIGDDAREQAEKALQSTPSATARSEPGFDDLIANEVERFVYGQGSGAITGTMERRRWDAILTALRRKVTTEQLEREVEKKQKLLTRIGELLNEQTYTAAIIKILSDDALRRADGGKA